MLKPIFFFFINIQSEAKYRSDESVVILLSLLKPLESPLTQSMHMVHDKMPVRGL